MRLLCAVPDMLVLRLVTSYLRAVVFLLQHHATSHQSPAARHHACFVLFSTFIPRFFSLLYNFSVVYYFLFFSFCLLSSHSSPFPSSFIFFLLFSTSFPSFFSTLGFFSVVYHFLFFYFVFFLLILLPFPFFSIFFLFLFYF